MWVVMKIVGLDLDLTPRECTRLWPQKFLSMLECFELLFACRLQQSVTRVTLDYQQHGLCLFRVKSRLQGQDYNILDLDLYFYWSL